MRAVIDKFLHYLRYERNASPHTQRNYQQDLEQFLAYLTPPRGQPVPLVEVNHHLIREFIGHLHDRHLEKSSVARKLASLRSFFKFCVREGLIDRKSTRLNSSHGYISYAVFCLKKKNTTPHDHTITPKASE